MCHNLWHGGRGPSAPVMTTPACCSINSIAVKKPDIPVSSESRFLFTQPTFDAPFRVGGGFPSEYCYAIWHSMVWYGIVVFNVPHRKTRMLWLPDGEIFLMICLFVLTEFTNVTDTHTDTHHMTTQAVLAQHCVAQMTCWYKNYSLVQIS